MKRRLLTLVSIIMIAAFACETTGFALAPTPASRNRTAKEHILAALERTQVIYADSDEAKRLLAANNASCLLFASGKYLVTKEVADDDLRLLRAITHEDIEAVMQIMARQDRPRYQAIKELVLKYYPPADSPLPAYLYVNHTVATAFEWLALIREGILARSDIPADALPFIEDIEPVILANAHNYFTPEFWSVMERGKIIRQALNRGMVFYQAASQEPITASAITATVVHEPYRTISRKFREKKRLEGLTLTDPHIELIEGILRRLAPDAVSPSADPDTAIVQALRTAGIRRILEIGCGDCTLLAALAPLARDAGTELVGIDLAPSPSPATLKILQANGTRVMTGNATTLQDNAGFDVILASGVMSLWGAFPESQLQYLAKTDPRTKKTILMDARTFRTSLLNAYDLAITSARLLSNNPRAALYANSLGSMLMLNKLAISRTLDVAEWDDSRKIDVRGPQNDMDGTVWQEKWVPLWKQGASFAILTKKGAAREEAPEPQAASDDIGRADVGQSLVLTDDLIKANLKEDRIYEIRYDTTRLTEEQRALVEAYITLLEDRAGNKSNIRRRPVASTDRMPQPLISVTCRTRTFTGEGTVNIDDRDLEKCMLRLVSMVNMALAASNIPDCTTDDEISSYRPLISYIQNQYRLVTGGELALPATPSELVKKIRAIDLPKPAKIDTAEIEQYNRAAIAALTAA